MKTEHMYLIGGVVIGALVVRHFANKRTTKSIQEGMSSATGADFCLIDRINGGAQEFPTGSYACNFAANCTGTATIETSPTGGGILKCGSQSVVVDGTGRPLVRRRTFKR